MDFLGRLRFDRTNCYQWPSCHPPDARCLDHNWNQQLPPAKLRATP
jgi:hypothetical protein